MLRSGCGTLGLASLFVGGLYFSILIEKGPENVGIPERGLVFVLITADSGNTGGEGEGVLALILRKKKPINTITHTQCCIVWSSSLTLIITNLQLLRRRRRRRRFWRGRRCFDRFKWLNRLP